jgi:hypothetical protein
MTEWKIGSSNSITIITEKNVDFRAFYVKESSTEGYNLFPGTFLKNVDIYVLYASIYSSGDYILKIVDLNSNMLPIFKKVTILAAQSPSENLLLQSKLQNEANQKVLVEEAEAEDRAVLNDIKAATSKLLADSAISELQNTEKMAAIKTVLDSTKLLVDSIVADMEALDESSINSIYAKLAAVKSDVSVVLASTNTIADDVWNKVL